ncbi:MAG TPA: 30S ribosomal protein S9 [Candidatus Babeliales bacterium]|nr:30S ribosomal protein S9 [Candidatus Babeliales bacterium]
MNKEKATKAVGVKKAGAPISHGVGRRKCSIARVWLRKGTGQVTVNGRTVENYFDTVFNRADAVVAFTVIGDATKYDADVNVIGGGVCSQAGAVRLGIARALVATDESYRKALRANDLLTVDSRQVERKKYGQPGARRKFQFVKR